MSDLAIRVEGLSKHYQIGSPQKSYSRLGDQLLDIIASPLRKANQLVHRNSSSASESHRFIWALKDVSFEVNQGEVVGFIGPNGAGKSTLLKILSKITEPTEGFAELYGRVGSLLEVGTGFHPELTGRENVYLNGAILGMRKGEIDRKFDEIVDFAEIEDFIDTPVKHYSSGMYVRLAFSVAAHLEPEILLVDEVLAVGDLAFQKKSLGKMDDVANQGRTVLFVSHNMGLLQTLCHRGVFIQQGRLRAEGPIADVIAAYLQTLEQIEPGDLSERTDRRGVGETRLVKIEVYGGSNGAHSTLQTGGPACFEFYVDRAVPGMHCHFYVHDHLGQKVVRFESLNHGTRDTFDPTTRLKFVCQIDELLLLPGSYRLDVLIIGNNELQDAVQAARTIEVAGGEVQGRPAQFDSKFRVEIPHQWILPGKD